MVYPKIMRYGIFPHIHVSPGSDVAQNNYYGITIDPKFPRYGAALAEERAEFAFKWRHAAPIMLVLSLILFLVDWKLTIFGVMLGALIPCLFPGFNREVERVGQSVYSSTASQCYGIPIDKLLDECANSLVTDYSYFKGYDKELVRAELVNHLKTANKWVFKHLPVITKDIKRNDN